MTRVASERQETPKRKPRAKQATPKDLCSEYSFRLGTNYISITRPEDVSMNLQDMAKIGVDVTAVFYLGTNNELRGRDIVHVGQPFPSFFATREICIKALSLSSFRIVLARIDTSGGTKPKPLDVEVTRFIYEECKLWKVDLVDHIVIINKGFLSFLHEGLLYLDKDKKPQQVRIGLATERMQ